LLPAGYYHLTANLIVVGIDHLKFIGSYRNYDTADNSHNNHVLAWVSLGEGYHNNHHKDPVNYNQAHKDNEFDICAWIIDKFFIEHSEKKLYKF